MIFTQQAPSQKLRKWVQSLWYCYAPGRAPRRELVLPNGCLQIILSLARESLTNCGDQGTAQEKFSRGILVGVRDRYQVIDSTDMEEIAGVVIRPGGFKGLFSERADLLFQRVVPLEDIWHESKLFECLADAPTPVAKLACLDRFLTGLAANNDLSRSGITDQTLYLLGVKHQSIAECARSIGISERRLSQVFREEVGASPKLWARIQRFQIITRALHEGVEMPWAELALTCGYYDQSHFANDFRAFSGLDASAYSKNVNSWQNHVPLNC